MSADIQVFHNGTILTDSGLIPDGVLVSRAGRIDHVGPYDPHLIPETAERIDAGGMYIAPGFVDIHVHGGAGSDLMDASPADIETVFRYHSAHGTTSLCPTTATAPLDEILADLDGLARYRSGEQRWGRALGAHIEGPYLAISKRGGHLPEHLRNPDNPEWRQILERGPIASLTLAPELPGARELVEALHKQGANANAGHSEALYHEISESIAWGVNHVTHLYCAMTDAMNNRWRGTPNPRAAGSVAPGKWADVILIDENVEVKAAYLGGRRL